jgi:hypothetical protein
VLLQHAGKHSATDTPDMKHCDVSRPEHAKERAQYRLGVFACVATDELPEKVRHRRASRGGVGRSKASLDHRPFAF